jgi:uncharacterized protein DUF1064
MNPQMSNWSQEDVDRVNAKRGVKLPAHLPPKSKYKNVRTKIGDVVFDSQREARYFLVLKAREADGEITNLCCQEEFPLYCPVFGEAVSSRQVAIYRSDFTFHDRDGVRHIVDAKGKKTQMFILKAKWLHLQMGIEIECV